MASTAATKEDEISSSRLQKGTNDKQQDITRILSEMHNLEKKLDEKLEEFKSEVKMEFRKFYEGLTLGGVVESRQENDNEIKVTASKITDTIANMSDRMGLVATIKDRAYEIYKKVENQKSTRGRNQDALLAACLYVACRQEDKPRTVKEVCSVANGATKKEIVRANDYIVKQLGLNAGQSVEMGTIHAGDFMRCFCSNLGMSNQAVKAAQEAVQKSEEFHIRQEPISVAAAAVNYIITQLSDDKKPLKDVSVATGVAEGTVRNS